MKRLDGRGSRRAHHARRPRSRGSLFQQVDQVQIGDPLDARTFLAASRLFPSRFTPFPAILARLVHAFVARANPFRSPLIDRLFALGLIRNADEPGRIQGIRADPIGLERNFRRRRDSFLAPPRLPRNGYPLLALFLRVPRIVPGRGNGKFLLPGRRGLLPSGSIPFRPELGRGPLRFRRGPLDRGELAGRLRGLSAGGQARHAAAVPGGVQTTPRIRQTAPRIRAPAKLRRGEALRRFAQRRRTLTSRLRDQASSRAALLRH